MDFSAKLLLFLSLGAASLSLAVEGEFARHQSVGSPPSLQPEFSKMQPPSAPPSGNPRVHPIILVPGDGGSQIEARLNKTEVGFHTKSENCQLIMVPFLAMWTKRFPSSL